jgi:hypothetical protein
LLSQALRTVAQDPTVRQSLDLGVDFAESAALRGDIDLARTALISALQQADGDQVARALQRSARNTQRAAPIGPLRQLRDASAITPETVLRPREHLAATLDHRGQRNLVSSRAGEFPLDEDQVAAVKALLTKGEATAADLGLELARRLVMAGLAVVG